jgi:hypothetical protein
VKRQCPSALLQVFLERPVQLDVVGDEHEGIGPMTLDGGEFRPHVLEGVKAVVNEHVDLPEPRKQWWQHAPARAA